MKIIHSADWHFREKDHDEITKCAGFVLDEARKEKPDLICISGDITDSKYLDLDSRSARTIFYIVNRMLDIAPVAIVKGTESHDGNALLALRECRGKYPILVSDTPEQFYYEKRLGQWLSIDEPTGKYYKPAFILTQIPQPTKQFFITELSIEDTEKAISEALGIMLAGFGQKVSVFSKIPHIVNGHFQVGGAFISETQQLIGRDIEVSKSQLASLNARLKCIGHIHKSQDMGDNIFYAGSPARMNFGETEPKGFYIHEVHGHKTIPSRFIETPAREKITAKFDLTQGLEQQALSICLGSLAEDIPSGCDLKIVITAWQDECKGINQAEIHRNFVDAGCMNVKISLIRKPRENVRAEAVVNAETLPNKLFAMAALRGEEVPVSVIDKAAAMEAGEKEPWMLKKEEAV